MLHTFLTTNRSELIDRCRQKVSRRSSVPNRVGSDHGIPQILDQLMQTLHSDMTLNSVETLKDFGLRDGALTSTTLEIYVAAEAQGSKWLEQGYSLSLVVHDYADVCQAVTDFASEKNASISEGEFNTMDRCLDNAIAEAVTAYAGHWKASNRDSGGMFGDKQLTSLAAAFRRMMLTSSP